MSTVGRGIWQETGKSWKMRNIHLTTWKMTKSLKTWKWEMHTEGPGIWRENWKSRKMRNTHFRTEIWRRKTEKGGNLEMSTVGRGIWQENWKSWKMRNIHSDDLKMTKSLKNGKMRNAHWRTWNMARKTENHGKWEIHTLGRKYGEEKLKKVENLEMSTVGRGIWQENWKSWKMRNIHLTHSENDANH